MNKVLLLVAVSLFSFLKVGCKNDMRYILFDDREELRGYVIFYKEKSENLCYFDLGRNRVYEIPSANVKMINGISASYDFYKDGDRNIMVKYEQRNYRPYLQFVELRFSDHLEQELIASKEVEGIFIDDIVDRFIYLHRTHELYYYNNYDREIEPNAKLVNIDTFETRKLFSEYAFTPHPVGFVAGKYLALGPSGIFFYDEDSIENISDDDNPFIKGSILQYSAVLEKLRYSSVTDGIRTIKIFDVADMRIIDTGIIPLKFDRFDSDKDKFHFFGERHILYARYRENAFEFAKDFYRKNIFLPGFLNPVEYIIYDYISGKDIGFVENCRLKHVYDFFPEPRSVN